MLIKALRVIILLGVVFLLALKFSSISNSSNPVDKDELPFGQLRMAEFEGIQYFYYIPFKAGAIRDNFLPVLVLVQSKQQDPAATAERWIDVAENEGVGLIVPVFNLECCANYPHIDLQRTRVDFRLLKILDHAKKLWRFDVSRLYMYGHAEGGEFVQRFALLYPERIKRAAESGATDYAFPDISVPFPYGIKRERDGGSVKFKMDEFVELEFAVVVGEKDDDPIRGDLASKQGVSRLERAKNFHAAIKKYAQNNRRKCNLRLEVIPDANHDYKTTLPIAREYLFRR